MTRILTVNIGSQTMLHFQYRWDQPSFHYSLLVHFKRVFPAFKPVHTDFCHKSVM